MSVTALLRNSIGKKDHQHFNMKNNQTDGQIKYILT